MLSDLWHTTPLFVLIFLSACYHGERSGAEGEQYVVNDSLGRDSAIATTIAPYQEELDSTMNVVLGYSVRSLRAGQPEGRLGNFVADLLLQRTQRWAERAGEEQVDLALLNNGGLRSSLPKGPVRKGRVFKLMPFENVVEVLELEHGAMKDLFRYMARDPQPIAGAELIVEEKEPKKVRIQGKALDSGRTYRVATSNFLAEGGDGMDFFEKAVSRTSTDIKVREMILRHIKALHAKGDSIRAKKDGRVKVIQSKARS